jgi:predicted phage baseplate assembly protein
LLLFGDAKNGRVPPTGAAILARRYRTGGGVAGNVAARTITQILAPAGGIEEAFNPLSAGGGADGEALDQLSVRGPRTLRHRGRALLPQDYESFAVEASPAVAFARAIPGRDPGGRKVPGWVTLLIIPLSGEPCPQPSFGLREQVRRHIEAHASADLAAAHRIYVTGPEYLPIEVDAVIVPLDPAEAGLVEQRARENLGNFFHPLRGGPEGRGWDLGRDVFLSDVAAALERVAGVDYVKELSLLLNSESQGERVKVADDRIVIAGQFRISLVQA